MGLADGAANLPAKLILPAVDKVVELRYEPAVAEVARVRSRLPHHSSSELADELIRKYRKELGAVGASSGGAAAMPVAGIPSAVGLAAADVTWTTTRLGQLILAVGVAYGHSAEELQVRRSWVLAVLGMAMGAASVMESAVPGIAGKAGVRVVSGLPLSQIVRINQLLGGRIIVKFGEKQGYIRLGTLVPFGIGAILGGGGNVLLARAVGNRAKDFFDDGGAPMAATAAVAA